MACKAPYDVSPTNAGLTFLRASVVPMVGNKSCLRDQLQLLTPQFLSKALAIESSCQDREVVEPLRLATQKADGGKCRGQQNCDLAPFTGRGFEPLAIVETLLAAKVVQHLLHRSS